MSINANTIYTDIILYLLILIRILSVSLIGRPLNNGYLFRQKYLINQILK